MRVDTIFHNGMIRGDMDHAPAAAWRSTPAGS
jgi:hypothetical protein